MGMGFEYWEVGFGKKLGWERGLVPPSGPSCKALSLSGLTRLDPDHPFPYPS